MVRKTNIYAHRGANRLAAENTRTAFDLALKEDINGMETDIQMSSDEVAVLWHDRFLNKLGMPDRHIDDFNYAELQDMNFAAHFDLNAPSETVMRLKDFLERYRARTRLLLEIKNRDWEPLSRHELKVRQTLAQVGAHHGKEVLISSFNLDSLIFAHGCSPNFPLVYNMEPEQGIEDARTVLAENNFLYGYCLHISRLDAEMVALLRSHNKLIAVYTCNSEAEIRQALALGVDILISDIPGYALKLRDDEA